MVARLKAIERLSQHGSEPKARMARPNVSAVERLGETSVPEAWLP